MMDSSIDSIALSIASGVVFKADFNKFGVSAASQRSHEKVESDWSASSQGRVRKIYQEQVVQAYAPSTAMRIRCIWVIYQ